MRTPRSVSPASISSSLRRTRTHETVESALIRDRWWKIEWFRGIRNDVKRRAPFYVSDWTDAWDYRIVPATVYMYFANVLPALAFSLDMFESTKYHYGVNEVLLASVLGSVVFSFFAAQPLCIAGVTGPITVFNYTVYNIVVPKGVPYLEFMCWIGLWSMVLHILLAITNACNAVKWVTRFSCDIFGFYVAFIYLQKGIQILTRQWEAGEASAYLSISIALLVTAVAYICGELGTGRLFRHEVRVFLRDYGTPLTVVFFTGFVHIGKMAGVELLTLPRGSAFEPTAERGWLVHFWNIEVGTVFVALPFAMLLTVLFYFDHNVSSLICQGTEFPLKKPAGFHWDILLLGLTTGISGLLGIPAPNGLIPQAPFHTASLCVTRQQADDTSESKKHTTVITGVVEQRASNLLQGLIILFTMCGPMLTVVNLIPQGVLAGLFFVMGIQALEGNGMTKKLIYLLADHTLIPPSEPLERCSKRSVWLFVALELFGFGATFAITQTIAAVGFPVFILVLIPIRSKILPKWFPEKDLDILDEPTASPFTLESVDGRVVKERERAEKEMYYDGGEKGARMEEGAAGLRHRDSRSGASEEGVGEIQRP